MFAAMCDTSIVCALLSLCAAGLAVKLEPKQPKWNKELLNDLYERSNM